MLLESHSVRPIFFRSKNSQKLTAWRFFDFHFCCTSLPWLPHLWVPRRSSRAGAQEQSARPLKDHPLLGNHFLLGKFVRCCSFPSNLSLTFLPALHALTHIAPRAYFSVLCRRPRDPPSVTSNLWPSFESVLGRVRQSAGRSISNAGTAVLSGLAYT